MRKRAPTDKNRTARGAGSAADTVVDLALRLLEHLAAMREPVGISELARDLSVPKATVHRHLQALVRHGFARQEPTTTRYSAGIKLLVLGERLRERFDILALAREELIRLRDETGQPATLSALVENQTVVLEVVQGKAIVNFGTQPGTVLDLHASAHGNIALAFGPETLLNDCLSRPLKAWTAQTICNPAALRRAIAQVRARGWATAPNRVLEGVNGLAAPIFNHAGNYVGAVAIAGSIQYIPASPSREQIRAVMQTAARVSHKLGWQRP